MKPSCIDVKGLLRYLILHELSKKKLCGDELAEFIGKRKSCGKLTPGTIYPVLKILREAKLIKLQVRGRKKLYLTTPKGKKEYTAAKKILKTTLRGVLK